MVQTYNEYRRAVWTGTCWLQIYYHSGWFLFEVAQTVVQCIGNNRHQLFKQFVCEGGLSWQAGDKNNGPQFKSYKYEEFLAGRGIRHTCPSPYHPLSSGLVERFNRVLKSYVQPALLQHHYLKAFWTTIWICTEPHLMLLLKCLHWAFFTVMPFGHVCSLLVWKPLVL